MKNKKNFISIVRIIFPIAFKASPFWLVLSWTFGILFGVFSGVQTYQLQQFFNNVEMFLSDNILVGRLLTSFVILILITILSQILNGAYNATMEYTSLHISGSIKNQIYEKAATLSTLYFESSENLDFLEKAKAGAVQTTYFLNIIFLVITSYIPYLIFMTVYLFTIRPIFSVSVFLISMPVILSQYFRIKFYTQLSDDSAAYQRKYYHYQECMKDRRYIKETRILGANNYFRNLLINTIKMHDEIKWITVKKTGLIELCMKIITLSGYIAVLFLFINATLKGQILVSSFVALFSSVNTLFLRTEELICRHIAKINENIGSIGNLVSFLEIPAENGDKDVVFNNNLDIRLNNVSFNYPGNEHNSISNINLNIKQGDLIAIVGENGAGKSTLVKLISGQYLPTKGEVRINDLSTKKIRREGLNKEISGVFQNFQKYALSIRDNIQISYPFSPVNEEKIVDTLLLVKFDEHQVGETLTLDTVLSRDFGGIDLSGGQWQKIAIARGIYKNCQLLLLDEPTAAIDPLEESNLYNVFANMAKGKTTVFVTHRLGAARIANKIIVMDKGKIVEMGTHDELINLNGEYANMYQKQRQLYSFSN